MNTKHEGQLATAISNKATHSKSTSHGGCGVLHVHVPGPGSCVLSHATCAYARCLHIAISICQNNNNEATSHLPQERRRGREMLIVTRAQMNSVGLYTENASCPSFFRLQFYAHAACHGSHAHAACQPCSPGLGPLLSTTNTPLE